MNNMNNSSNTSVKKTRKETTGHYFKKYGFVDETRFNAFSLGHEMARTCSFTNQNAEYDILIQIHYSYPDITLEMFPINRDDRSKSVIVYNLDYVYYLNKCMEDNNNLCTLDKAMYEYRNNDKIKEIIIKMLDDNNVPMDIRPNFNV